MVNQSQTLNWEEELNAVFKANGRKEWQDAASRFEKALPEKTKAREEIAETLCQQLHKDETSARNRSRIISLLARFELPDLIQKIVPFTNPKNEPSDRVQYWALSAIATMAPDNLDEILNKIIKHPDTNSRVTAVARRIQLQNNGLDEPTQSKYFQELLNMTTGGNADNRWAVMSALINNDYYQNILPPNMERRAIIEVLGPALMNEAEWRDVRMQAARTLGTTQHNFAEAISVLSTTYNQTTSEDIKRQCLESLASIGVNPALKKDNERQWQDVQNFMIEALESKDPDIRSRAINTLKASLKTKGALEVIVSAILSQDKDDDIPGGYIEALRRVDASPDNQQVVELLTQHLWHPDPDVQTRASATLELIGGEKAMRILIGQQRHFIDTYTQILNNADEQIMAQFDGLMKNARFSFNASMGMHLATFTFGILLALFTLRMASNPITNEVDIVWLTGTFLSFATSVFATFYKKPLRNIHESTLNLVKVNIAFLGYMRQINQIDATFKQLFLNPAVFDAKQMEATVQQIQTAVDQSLAKVQTFIERHGADDST